MIEPILEDIKQYVYEQGDKEACGLLSLQRGRIKWNPCPNVAENPKNDFIIDPYDYKAVADEGDVVAALEGALMLDHAVEPVARRVVRRGRWDLRVVRRL